MRRFSVIGVIVLVFLCLAGCSRETPEKIRYDMEKLVFMNGKLAERLNVQPQLTTASDSASLKSGYEHILDYYYTHRDSPLLSGREDILRDMNKMAIGTQIQVARYYAIRGNADSVIAAYRRIGKDIPADQDDLRGATLALAITYRTLNNYDSTLAMYDRLLTDFYPPIDSLNRVNPDIMAVPIDKLKIARVVKGMSPAAAAVEAIAYYTRLQNDYPDLEKLRQSAMLNTSRIYTMIEEWDDAIVQLEQVLDSTGRIAVPALAIIANIYNGPKQNTPKAIEIYRTIIDRQPDSAIIGNTLLRLGAALCREKDYIEGRKVLADLRKKFAAYPRLAATAQFYYAQSYEAEDEWDRALSEYQWLMENYPYSEEAFQTARHIPERYEQNGNASLAEIWFGRAEDFYLRSARAKQGQGIEVLAYSYLAELYRITGQWDKALETLEHIHALVPGTQIAAKSLYNAATTAYRHLGDSVRAQGYLDRLNDEFGTTDSTQIYQEDETQFNIESIK